MDRQHRINMIIGMADNGAFYENPTIVRNRNRIHFHSTWFLLRSNTIQQIVVGNINQTDSSIINSITLSNNIPRRAMEFVVNAPEQYQTPTIPMDDEYEEYFNNPNNHVDYHTNNNNHSDSEDDDHNYGRDSDDFDNYYDGYRTDI